LATANGWENGQATTDRSGKPGPEGEWDEEVCGSTSSHKRIDTPDETPGTGQQHEAHEAHKKSQLDKI